MLIVMLSVIMLSVKFYLLRLSVFVPSYHILIVMLSVGLFIVPMIVIMLSVVAPN